METSGIQSRLSELVDAHKSQASFARAVGISGTMLRKYLEGSEPGVSIAARIAAAAGVRLEWLILGTGPKFAADLPVDEEQAPYVAGPAAEPVAAAGADALVPLDGELLGRVVDRVARVYREAGVSLPDVELGRLAAAKYAEIQALADDPDEWAPALDLMAVRLRKALLQAAAEPGSAKSRA